MHQKNHFSIKNLDFLQLDSTLVRRKSCVCEDCGATAPKENRLPNQLCEIAYHKQERLAEVFLSKLEGARKYMRNDHKKRNFRIYARNPLFILRSQPDLEETLNQTSTPSRQQTPQGTRLKTEQHQPTHYRSFKYVPMSNCFLQNLKQQVKRSNQTINRLLTDRRTIQSFQSTTCDKQIARSPQKKKFNCKLKPIPKQKMLQTRFNCMIREFFNSSKSKQY